MKIVRTLSVIVISAASMVLAGGCAHSGEPRIDKPEATLPEAESSPGFLDRMSSTPTVTQNDAMRGLLFLLQEKDPAGNFAQRVEMLHGKEIIPGGWTYNANKPLNRGQLAYMIYQACGIDGGIILHLTGPSCRYCLRELQYQRIMAEGLANTSVTGMEFIAVLGRAGAYMEYGRVPDDLKIPEGG